MILFFAALLGTVIAFPEISRWKKPNVLHQRELSTEHRGCHKHSTSGNVQDVGGSLAISYGDADGLRTTTTVTEAVTTLPGTLTVPQITALVTTTITAGHIWKRDSAAALTSAVSVEAQPYGYDYDYVSLMASSAARNAAIASSVYSACSCLHIAPKTVSSQATVQSTRTIRGYEASTVYAATVSTGTSTLTVTSSVLPQYVPDYPYFNASEPSANSTSYTTISSTSTRYNTVYSTGTALPPYSLNTTSSSPPYPTSNTTSTVFPTATPSLNSTSAPYVSSSSTTSSSSLLPIATSIAPAGCPSVNNTIFNATGGKQYQIQCYRAYGGPVSIGLDVHTFRECIEECSKVNDGFSAIRCYGVTWLKYSAGVHCTLKAQSALVSGTYNVLAASAVLLTGVPPPVVGEFKGQGGGLGDGIGKGQLGDDDAGTWRVGHLG